MQVTHQNSIFKEKSFPITLVCDQITQTSNIGGLLRLADAFGIEHIVFCGEVEYLPRKSKRSSRATENWVIYSFESDTESIIKSLKDTHFILGLEITTQSVSIRQLKLNIDKNIAVVIGNENYGITDHILKLCDQIVHIDMFGKNSSMSVTQAASIILYELTRKILKTKDSAL